MKIEVLIPVYNQEELVVKALDSIPIDWGVLICDDGSTDNTLSVITDYERPNMRVLTNDVNMGVGSTVNKLYDNAQGEYTLLLGSDDYLLPEITQVADQLDSDMVFFGLRTNNGAILMPTPENYTGGLVGSVKFMRRQFLGDIRGEPLRAAEDWSLMQKLKDLPHTTNFTGIVGKHYNFPREGSLYYLSSRGEL